MTPCYVCQKPFPDSELDEHYLEHIPMVDEPTQQQVSLICLYINGKIGREGLQ